MLYGSHHEALQISYNMPLKEWECGRGGNFRGQSANSHPSFIAKKTTTTRWSKVTELESQLPVSQTWVSLSSNVKSEAFSISSFVRRNGLLNMRKIRRTRKRKP